MEMKAIGHEGDKLRVQFKHGGLYEYQGVTAEEFAALLAAESVGKAYHALIKEKGIQGVKIG